MSLIIVSNRLPYKIVNDVLVESDGGLASCLKNIKYNFTWIGWLNSKKKIRSNIKIETIELTISEQERYYDNFCNKFLWYVFHGDLSKYYEDMDYQFYQQVNLKFANAILKTIQDDNDIIWIHDYHLLHTAFILKQIFKIKNKILYFHHIEFPDNIKKLNKRLPDDFVENMKYFDLIASHTAKDIDNLKKLFIMNEINYTNFLVNPIGINPEYFKNLSLTIQPFSKNKIIILGIDRLDFIKGLSNKFEAINILLKKYPSLRGKIQLFQLVIPSRESINKKLKYKLEQQISKINGIHSSFEFDSPIKYQYGKIDINELIRLYKSSDICLITSIADGMNLVSMEYCACNPDGLLCLSNKTGASNYLKGVIKFDPDDVYEIMDSLYNCIKLIDNKKITSEMMAKNMEFINKNTSDIWVDRMLGNINMEYILNEQKI